MWVSPAVLVAFAVGVLRGSWGWWGRAPLPVAPPSGSAFVATRIGAVGFRVRSSSSVAPRARAFGLPSPLNVHRPDFFIN